MKFVNCNLVEIKSLKVSIALVSFGLALMSCTVNADEEHPCGSIPDPFPEAQQTGSSKAPARVRFGREKSMPECWDARDHGWVTSVKNQGSYGTCWSFAACSVLETALLKGGYGAFDLSEKNMVLYSGWNATANTGGNITMSGNYFTSWQGPALETEEPYPTSGNTDADFGGGRMVLPKFKVLGAVRIPKRTSVEDTATMKEAIIKYGSLVVPYKSCTKSSCYIRSTGACYCNEYTNTTSHLVAVVGWDDNYSKGNFKRTPPGDGAWIVKNSWGPNRDDEGYLHISYYHTTFGLAAEMEAFILAEPNQDYDAVYNYARAGFCTARGWGNTTDMIAGASIFTAASDSKLAAVGFYAMSDATEYTIQIYTGCETYPNTGTLVYSGERGQTSYRGYVTVPLSTEVELKRGTRFSVIVNLRCPTYGYPLAYSNSVSDWGWITVTAEAAPGQTFYRNASRNGSWKDFAQAVDSTASFCCAAYVREANAADNSTDTAYSGTTWDASSLVDWHAEIDNTTSGRLQFGKTPGAFAHIQGLNGYSMIENYMLGFSPEIANEKLQLLIRMNGEEPIVEWNHTNSAVSVYSLLGSTDLSTWHKKVKGDRFFKLQVSLP